MRNSSPNRRPSLNPSFSVCVVWESQIEPSVGARCRVSWSPEQRDPLHVHCFYLARNYAGSCLGSQVLVVQEMEALGLSVMVSLAVLVLEIAILGMYLSAFRRKTSRQKLEPYLVILYLLICCSTAAGFLIFYGGEASNFKTATQNLVLVCLVPNFAIIFILIHTLGFYRA